MKTEEKGLAEALQKILEGNEDRLEVCIQKEKGLTYYLQFCKDHNYKEEARITQVELTAIGIYLTRYKGFTEDIQKLLNNWNR